MRVDIDLCCNCRPRRHGLQYRRDGHRCHFRIQIKKPRTS